MPSHAPYIPVFLLLATLGAGCAPDQPVTGAPAPQLRTTDDLADKRLGVMLGTFHDTLAQKLYPNATIIQYESSNDLPLAITTGKIDAAFSDRDRLVERLRDNPQLAVLGEPLVRMPVAVGLRKGNTELRDAFNVFLAEIKGNGVHADMVDRWLVKRGHDMPEVQAAEPRGEIIIGMSSSGALPFAAIMDGELVGFDVELGASVRRLSGEDRQLHADAVRRSDRRDRDRESGPPRQLAVRHRREERADELHRSLPRGGRAGLRPGVEHRGQRSNDGRGRAGRIRRQHDRELPGQHRPLRSAIS